MAPSPPVPPVAVPGFLPMSPLVALPPLPPDATPAPVESYLARLRRRPVAVAGIVENGLVRPLDSSVKLPEHSRVIIVATEGP